MKQDDKPLFHNHEVYSHLLMNVICVTVCLLSSKTQPCFNNMIPIKLLITGGKIMLVSFSLKKVSFPFQSCCTVYYFSLMPCDEVSSLIPLLIFVFLILLAVATYRLSESNVSTRSTLYYLICSTVISQEKTRFNMLLISWKKFVYFSYSHLHYNTVLF